VSCRVVSCRVVSCRVVSRVVRYCKTRLVKVFARSESGEVRCVCTFLQRLIAPRQLESSLHALRWVRLIDWRRTLTAASDVWAEPSAFLARRSGDHADHSLLLCAALLGFGLDAYVAIGTVRIAQRTT
jgi:hypothetical protein